MNSLKNRFFFWVGIYTLMILSLFIVSTYYIYQSNINDIYEKNSSFIVQTKNDCIKEFVKEFDIFKNHLFTLSQTSLFEDYLNNKIDKSYIEAMFISTISSNNLILQLNYIDIDGNELIKINKQNNSIYITSQDKLTNIRNTSFFKDSVDSFQKIYTSQIELTTINNQIVTPFLPIIKISTKVYKDKQVVGLITSYINVNFLLHKLSHSSFLKTYLFDNDGYIIFNPDSTKNWSRYFNGDNIKDLFPEKHQNMMSIDCHNGDFFARQIYIDGHKYSLIFQGNIKHFDVDNKNISWFATILFILFSFPLSIILFRQFSKFVTNDKDRIKFLENSVIEKSRDLKLCKSRFETIEKIATIGIFEYNIQNDTIWMSDKLYNIFNISDIQVTKEEIISLINHIDKNYVISSINDMIDNNIKEKELKFRIKVDLATKVIKLKLELFVDDEKKALLLKGVCQDITKEDMIEKELIEYKNLLEIKVEQSLDTLRKKDDILLAQSRLASMGELISMIAHQWRQPLSRISTTLANMQVLFRLNTFDKEQISLEIDNVNKQVKKLNETISEFRTFFQPKENKDNIYVKNLVSDTVKLIQPLIEEHSIEIIVNNNCKEVVNTFANKLVQIILNILKNAIDQLVEQKVLEPKIYITCTVDDNRILYIKIADNGGGVCDDILFNIFDPYFSTKGKNGVGLGLFISKTIANKYLDGDIKVYNNKEGAVFLIEIPIKEKKNEK